MDQENPIRNVHDNLASDSHNNLNVMTESVVIDNTNSDLYSNIPSDVANIIPHDSSSISLLTTQPDSIHQNQVIKYNNNQSFQNLLEEARNMHNNYVTDSKRLQYLSTMHLQLFFYSKNIVILCLNLMLMNTKNGMKMNHLIYLQKK